MRDKPTQLTFRNNIAQFVTENINLRSIPDVALQAIEEGFDSPSLLILAGLLKNENEFLIDRYFKDALQELSIELPDKRQAAIEVGLAIADEIIEGKQDIFEGVRDIRLKAIYAYPFFDESKQYCYDSIGFEKAYGLFDTIDELKAAGSTQWQSDKTNQELEEVLKKDLLTELKVWSVRMKNGS